MERNCLEVVSLFLGMKLLTNIRQLLVTGDFPRFLSGKKMQEMPFIENAYLLIQEGRIVDYGKMTECHYNNATEISDISGQIVLPCWCDSHTHLVFAAGREDEFVDRIQGLSYEEIALKGGGILNSAKRLREMSEDFLFDKAKERLEAVLQLGTGAIEIKSGYGLSYEDERKMLTVIRRLKDTFSIPIKATLLAAHALPQNYAHNRQDYIDLITDQMIPDFSKEGLVDFIDVFCEKNYFTVAEMEAIMEAGLKYGLPPKVHVNQFNAIGGVTAAVNYNALSVDHLEVITQEDIIALQRGSTIPVALPGCSFFLNIPYTPARQIIDQNLPLAIATDYNPGSAPSGNMNFAVSQACINLKMTPQEAIAAATINAAFAMGIADEVGSITRGKRANLIITKPIKSFNALPYYFGNHCIEDILINGISRTQSNTYATKF